RIRIAADSQGVVIERGVAATTINEAVEATTGVVEVIPHDLASVVDALREASAAGWGTQGIVEGDVIVGWHQSTLRLGSARFRGVATKCHNSKRNLAP